MKRILNSLTFLILMGSFLFPTIVFADTQSLAAAACEGNFETGTPAYDSCVATEIQNIEARNAENQAAANAPAAAPTDAEQQQANEANQAAQDAAVLENANDPTVVDLYKNGFNVNDNSSFDVGGILSTNGQNTDRFLKTGNGGPVIAFVLGAINFITLIIGSIAMILIIIGGLLMIVSEGDENRLQRGQGILTSAIIGLVIAMASYLIVTFVQSIFY